ncbi:cytochrome P450 [Polyangium jinanense]|uniref:Cytochrome P450 n=1 Tax=Polyangium jinanense TaxID=2829994 RepID=A0A9X4AQT1_9BACT|nr:cytochrome P450 [Polyangium jinanense]MDC3979400.1 cytochrome P450 [Polyangium jinanense]
MARLNLLDPQVRANPYPYYAELRRAAPVSVIDPGEIWAISRYDDVVSVLKNPAVFSSQGLRAATEQPWAGYNPLTDSLVLLDPPRHTAIRSLVNHAFTLRVLPRVEPLARKVARAFAERASRGLEVDICDDLATTLPAQVIGNLLGLDDACDKFRTWSETIVAISPGTPEALRPSIVASIAELGQYLEEVFEDRRRARRDDLASDLLDAEIDGRRLDQAELMSFMFVLFVAGFETTTHLLVNSLRILAERPELLARLREAPSVIPHFVEEALRFDPSVHVTLRVATRDTEIAGVPLPAGAVVAALLASANRDETRYEHADRFDVDRDRKPSVAFGHGIHFCLGAPLARAETRIAFEELVPRVGAIHVTQEPTWNCGLTVRGVTSCRMRFEPL